MGYELWTSPITGYRRRGTRLAELRALLTSGITARAIIEPLLSCPADAPSAEMRAALDDKGFDIAGVQQRRNGPVIGYIATESLTDGHVKDHMNSVSLEQITSESTPLVGLLSIFKKRQYVFVLSEQELRGIVTGADLNKPPVRVYLFGLISLLEMHLSYWVKATYGNQSWQALLKPERLEDATKVQSAARSRKQDMALEDCLQFCDSRDLVLASTELREKLVLGSKTKGEAFMRHAEDMRNNLGPAKQ